MSRWQAGASQRLHLAALELFTGKGYDATTAAEIAAAVGLTERTFYRHYRDKAEVLFRGGEEFIAVFVDGMAAAPPGSPPMLVVATALEAAGALFNDDGRRPSRLRRAVIETNPSLQERERHKLAELADAMADALRARGIGEPAATLAAESGVTVFTLAFTQWLDERETRPLSEIEAELLGELAAVTQAVR